VTGVWPRPGRCGACARAAVAFPSGRWEHIGWPCRAFRQLAWAVDDAAQVRATLRFVPDGEPLPPASDGWRAWMRGGAS
jgi:hypothetical protein